MTAAKCWWNPLSVAESISEICLLLPLLPLRFLMPPVVSVNSVADSFLKP